MAPLIYSGFVGGATAAAAGYIGARKAIGCDIDTADLISTTLFGAATGALMPVVGTTGAGATLLGMSMGAAQDVAGSLAKGESVNPMKTAVSGVLGAAGGAVPWKATGTWKTARFPGWEKAGESARMRHSNPAFSAGTGVGAAAAFDGELANARLFGGECSCK